MRIRPVNVLTAGAVGTLGMAVVAAWRSHELAAAARRREQMVITVLEAHVAPERWGALQQSYETRARVLPPQIVESFLAQSVTDSSLWRILTVWRSQDALAQMRQSGETPTGILIFRDAGAEPALAVFTVHANPRARGAGG